MDGVNAIVVKGIDHSAGGHQRLLIGEQLDCQRGQPASPHDILWRRGPDRGQIEAAAKALFNDRAELLPLLLRRRTHRTNGPPMTASCFARYPTAPAARFRIISSLSALEGRLTLSCRPTSRSCATVSPDDCK